MRGALLLWLCGFSLWASAQQQVQVAVASNFLSTARELASIFSEQSGFDVQLSAASTGKLYAQIRQGAPFDVFLAADCWRPGLLIQAGIGVPASRFTYALGKLVWVAAPGTELPPSSRMLLQSPVAIANPALAPYGKAALQILEKRFPEGIQSLVLIQGENVSQALQFVFSGNATLGLVSEAQVRQLSLRSDTSLGWLGVDAARYSPPQQQALQLTENSAGAAFLAFLKTAQARVLIQQSGYLLP